MREGERKVEGRREERRKDSCTTEANRILHPYCDPCLVLQELIRNQRKTNNGKDYPVEFLTEIYHRIR